MLCKKANNEVLEVIKLKIAKEKRLEKYQLYECKNCMRQTYSDTH